MDYTETCKAQEKLDPPASCVVFTSDKSFTQDEEKNNSEIHNKKENTIEETKHSCLFFQGFLNKILSNNYSSQLTVHLFQKITGLHAPEENKFYSDFP